MNLNNVENSGVRNEMLESLVIDSGHKRHLLNYQYEITIVCEFNIGIPRPTGSGALIIY